MSLFTIENSDNHEKVFGSAVHFKMRTEAMLGRARKSISEVIGNLEKEGCLMYVSGGRWSAHDLRFWVLDQTGPADVWMSTWAMGEDSARMLYSGLETGLIQKLYCLFDRRLPVRKAKIMQMAQHICTKVSLVDCHAKITVIKNAEWAVTICGSANDTNNKRIEGGVIICSKEIADFNINWMEKQLNDGDPFEWRKID
ncbi:MAG: hypothetical protein KA954_11460 [Chitinophagales bacterium]|nr:hypothetical protein [Chitinophagales bacterium]MBP9704640.1 hypothetical protein [Chitinophagales bacterium]